MKRWLVLFGALAACSQQQIPTPQRTLNRPVDIAVACVSGGDSARTAVPPAICNTKTTTAGPPCDSVPSRALGFIPNSASGELAIASLNDTDSGLALLQDLDSSRPGYNFLPVGRLPVAAQTTSDGCRVIVANEGSCDFHSVDVTAVANAADNKIEPTNALFRIQPTTASGRRILARPRAMQLIPASKNAVDPNVVCSPDVPYHAYVAYPGCDLVAEIDMSTGQYVRGVFVRPDGVVDAGPDPVCPVECADSARDSDLGPIDAGAGADAALPDGGLPPSDATHTRPVALALDDGQPHYLLQDSGKQDAQGHEICNPPINEPYHVSALYIGGSSTRFISRIQINPDGSFGTIDRLELDSCPPPANAPPPANPLPTCDPIGVTRLRLSPPAPGSATFPNSAGHFLYAPALDQSVRVIDVDAFRECETQADPQMIAARFPPTNDTDPLSGLTMNARQYLHCLPLDENIPPPAGAPPLRRAFATGPGIRVTGSPIDVAFAQVHTGTTGAGDPTQINGLFAYVLSSNGIVTVINFDTDFSEAKLSHTIHNRNFQKPGLLTGNDPQSGGAAVDPTTQIQALPSNVGAQETDAPTLALLGRQCVQDMKPSALAIHFPDPQAPRPETWVVAYEGAIPGMLRAGGQLLEDTPSTLVLLDPGARYCNHGVVPGDFVNIAGCANDSQCATGQACFGAVSGEPGVCLPYTQDPNGSRAPAAGCIDFINTRHQYRVASTFNGSVVLDEKPLVIPRATGCTSDADCENLDVVNGGGVNAPLFPNKGNGGHLKCDPKPWPGTNVRQCVVTCDPPTGDSNGWTPKDEQCRPNDAFGGNPAVAGLFAEYSGYVCGHDPIDGDPSHPRRCVAARIPRDPFYDYDPRVGTPTANQCFTLPIVYEAHAGLSMIMVGNRAGYLHNITTAADGSCVADPSRGPTLVGRLSYNAPVCQTPTDLEQGQFGHDEYEAGFGANGVCVWNGTKPVVSPNPCLRRAVTTSGALTPANTMLVWQVETPIFEAAIGPVAPLDPSVAIVPAAPGQPLPGILAPPFGTVYQFNFTINGGFNSLVTQTNAYMPSVLHAGTMFPGPPQLNATWLYVIDSGDQVSQQQLAVLTGQMVRVDPETLILDPHTSVQ